MRTLAVIVVLLGANSARAQPSDGSFWAWFAAHADELHRIERADDPGADGLAEHLHAIHPSLTFELGARKGDALHELVVSADGDIRAFATVRRLVAAAPKVRGWKIIAFRPRTPSVRVEIDHVVLDPRTILFRELGAHDGKLDIALELMNVSAVTPSVKRAAFLILDATLGELDAGTHLGIVDFEATTHAPPDSRALASLPGRVDALK